MELVLPCCHEEAYTRMFVHERDATVKRSKSLTIKANDTDVVVIEYLQCHLCSCLASKLLVCRSPLVQGSSARRIPVHKIVSAIEPEKASGIYWLRHCVCFSWEREEICMAWDDCGQVMETVAKLSHCPKEVSHGDLQRMDHFVVVYV